MGFFSTMNESPLLLAGLHASAAECNALRHALDSTPLLFSLRFWASVTLSWRRVLLEAFRNWQEIIRKTLIMQARRRRQTPAH